MPFIQAGQDPAVEDSTYSVYVLLLNRRGRDFLCSGSQGRKLVQNAGDVANNDRGQYWFLESQRRCCRSLQWTLADNAGETFNAGDVLLEIETDKAQMDVEAQDSGILAKILVPDGTQKVNVGKVIAVLAEEGDDISAVGVAAESLDTSSAEPANKVKEKSRDVAQTSQDEHKRHLKFENTYLPAVLRLLQLHDIEDPTQIHGTGPHGRLLKGDVLAHLGTIKSDVPKSLQRILEEKQRLDLSNIIVQRCQDKPQQVAIYSSEATMKPPPFACIEETVGLTAALQVQKEISGGFGCDLC